MDEKVDILQPPLFTKSGEVKTRAEANRNGDWIATFNLWVVTKEPEPCIVYQQRSPNASWAPGKLDVAAGGHLMAGEDVADGLREAKEELGKTYDFQKLVYLGRKLYVGSNVDGMAKHNVIGVYLVEDDAPLASYALQEKEVFALCVCPVKELLRAHRDASYHFTAQGILANGNATTIDVSKDSFPENYDDYHYKMAVLADRFFKGEQNLLY